MLKGTLFRWQTAVIVVLIAAAVLFSLSGWPDGKLHVWFLDVGQGDAIFIETPEGRQILIDGGPSPAALLSEIGDILPYWDRSIDVVILTHPDADHLTGLIPLLERYRVASVLDAVEEPGDAAQAWLAAVARAGSQRAVAERGVKVLAGSATLTVLNPAGDRPTAASDNNGSVVVRLDFGQISVLLTGDAEMEAERELVASALPLNAGVLKVGHHGSASSTSASFVAAVAPSVAVIQVGADNDFGHPRSEVLSRLAGITVLRTDQAGRIEIISDGTRLWARTERGQAGQ